ncbi:hypothetical protein AB0F88_40025 [Streptosporangium sp. NPDC023963]|uniref:hypothetical protein n=1 Tax=Streptosporangium sp. NPDC023963 TaxID=3155608 RepID=UPI0034223E74
MRLFRRHRGSQTDDVTPNYEIHVVPPNGDPAEFERIARAAFARQSRPAPKQPSIEQSISVRCSCGNDMSPSALLSATENSRTVRMTCGGCTDTVDITFLAVAK